MQTHSTWVLNLAPKFITDSTTVWQKAPTSDLAWFFFKRRVFCERTKLFHRTFAVINFLVITKKIVWLIYFCSKWVVCPQLSQPVSCQFAIEQNLTAEQHLSLRSEHVIMQPVAHISRVWSWTPHGTMHNVDWSLCLLMRLVGMVQNCVEQWFCNVLLCRLGMPTAGHWAWFS